MVDIDYNALIGSYQKKVTELINQTIVYEAKINALTSLASEQQETINSLTEKLKSLDPPESDSDSFE